MAQMLYIIDGHSQIYRAYYAPFRDLTSPAGEPTRATYVFCSMLLKFIADRRPAYLAMALDGPAAKLKRRAVFPDYKVTRKPMPEDLLPQVGRIVQIVRAMGIATLQAEGYEADDLIATAVEALAGPDLDVVAVSRDKDLDQLIGPHATMYDPMKDQVLDAQAVLAEKGYAPEKAIEVQTLSGDSIDNIPGIPGVGPKTAAKLIATYGTAEAVLAHADELTPGLSAKVKQHAANIPLARKLVTLDRHVPIAMDLAAMRFAGLPVDVLRPIFKELGFHRLLEQLDKLAKDRPELIVGASSPGGSPAEMPARPPAGPAPAEPDAAAGPAEYRCLLTVSDAEALAMQLKGVRKLALAVVTTSPLPVWGELVGLALAWQPGQGIYLPIRGPLGQATVPVEQVAGLLGPILADPAVEKVGHDLKLIINVLTGAGMAPTGPLFDTMIAAHVMDSTRNSFQIGALAAELLGRPCPALEDVLGRGRTRMAPQAVPADALTDLAAQQADVALRLAPVLDRRLAAEKLTDLFACLEMPLVPVLGQMERRGVAVDPAVLKRMEVDLSKRADALRDRILAAAGCSFNVDSPRQLADVLFTRLHLPAGKMTKTGPSTDSDVLENLAALHELPGLVLDYRKLTKLLSTYLVALAQCIHPVTRRVHTTLNQAVTVTGRLSSSDPNLQNIPVRTEEGRQIRSAFVAGTGFVLLSADYSQVELRVLAHFCEDPTLMRAFHDDQDIHRIVAAEVFGLPAGQVSPEQRARAKTVNFGIIYGQTAFGLARTLRISRGEAGEFIAAYRKRFPRIEEFLQACIAQAKAQGYVETIFRRRRRIADIDSRNPQKRALAERLAINSVVQGSAADLIKQAMVNIAGRIAREGRPSRMLLQIHDELLFETPPAAVADEREMIVAEMTGAIRLRVPLKVDTGVGPNWMDA